LTPDPLLLAAIRSVAQITLRATGAERSAAYLWDGERGALAVAAARGYHDEAIAGLEAGAAREDSSVLLAAQERIQTDSDLDETGQLTSAWPVVIGREGIEEPVGALAIEAEAPPSSDLAERVAAIADLIAIVVDRARLATNAAERIDWAERVANSDLLTGLANARTASRVMELELARAARQGSELTVALFDVDDLTTFTVDRPFTVSAGLARFPDDGKEGDALVRAAESALRAAQAAGRGTFAEAVHEAAGGNGTGKAT
jgi:GGDEF domain-containing protein